MIERLIRMGQKRRDLIYNTSMLLLITFQMIFLLWIRHIVVAIGLGFNIGLFIGVTLSKLFLIEKNGK